MTNTPANPGNPASQSESGTASVPPPPNGDQRVLCLLPKANAPIETTRDYCIANHGDILQVIDEVVVDG